jgi:peptide/nickel transport system permease protein
MVYSGILIGFLGFGVWAHHMFSVGMGPIADSVFSLATMLIAIPFGLVAGMRKGRLADRAATTSSLVALSAPTFAVGFLLMYVFAVKLDWFPAFGSGDGFLDTLWHMTLPAVTLAISQIAIVLRQTRAAAMDVADRDYITFARARAVPSRRIWQRYVLHNASLPVLTSAGLVLAYSLTGAVLVENVFALQGLGALLVVSVAQLDLPVVQALTLFTALLVLTTNLVVDLLYFALDPRLRRAAVTA